MSKSAAGALEGAAPKPCPFKTLTPAFFCKLWKPRLFKHGIGDKPGSSSFFLSAALSFTAPRALPCVRNPIVHRDSDT
jgi:hypothetical protein